MGNLNLEDYEGYSLVAKGLPDFEVLKTPEFESLNLVLGIFKLLVRDDAISIPASFVKDEKRLWDAMRELIDAGFVEVYFKLNDDDNIEVNIEFPTGNPLEGLH